MFDSDGQAPVNDLAPYVLNTNFQNFSLPDEEEIADEGAIARLFGRFFERNVKNIVLIDRHDQRKFSCYTSDIRVEERTEEKSRVVKRRVE